MDGLPNGIDLRVIDVTGDICPTTFIKVKLELEDLAPGSLLEVRVREGSSLENVARSVVEDGHTIASRDPGGLGIVRLLLRRGV